MYGVRGDMEERWSGILVDITYTVDSIKGVGLRCFSVGVSNGLTVWVVGLFVVSVLVGYQESDAA